MLVSVKEYHADAADIDRQNLAATRLQGILEDLNMDAQQFATAIAILYGMFDLLQHEDLALTAQAGYIPFQIPSNYLISLFPRPGLCG
jgi:hypothetical protein